MASKQWNYRAELVRCVDGNKFDAIVDLGFYFSARIRFRLLGVDTPERGQTGFTEATDKLEELLRAAILPRNLIGDPKIILIETAKTGKYGRWLARIDGVNDAMKQWLRESGFEK